ncbi:hypothetical protein LEN26_000028 [Aphanomyces euteiches]|nr:hypothetical protein AeMF1_015836 [Aphanomyces euteiches]KAH9164451.1 hypothetical protein LEN26_000028 [Aphanomyces euteiches]KAH9195100.1 hypothetical protein AeNC1_002915 [Aphanomyces euteiches]
MLSLTTGRWMRRFHTLGLNAELVNALKKNGISKPSQVQRLAIPLILDDARPDVVVGAETGSGKTLAYLLPLIQRLQSAGNSLLQKPAAIVMVPNQELVKQIEVVANTYAAHIPLACLTKTNAIPRYASIVVGTPKAILEHTSPKDMHFVETIVVDEADMLLGGGFERDTKQVLGVIRNQPLLDPKFNVRVDDFDNTVEIPVARYHRQTIFSAATIPTYGRLAVSEYLKRKFPDAEYIITEQFHRTVPTLDQKFVHLNGSATREQALLKVLREDEEQDGCTLIFVDSVASAKNLHAFLTSESIECMMLHKEIPREERTNVLRQVAASSGQKHIVVATDIAARGLDLPNVNHVIQYEFATDVVSHIHRIGRTARGGSSGKVTNLIGDENKLVYNEIAAAGSHGSLTKGFSRRRSLRKKFKKNQTPSR